MTAYAYVGDPAWAKDVNAATPNGLKTWNQWRGYREVAVTTGAENTTQEYTKTLYYRGMHGDDDGNGGTKTVNVTDSTGTSTLDRWWLAGQPREVEAFDGPQGARFSSTITSYGNRSAGTKIRMPLVANTTTATRAAAGGTHELERTYTHDPYGLVETVDDHAREHDAQDNATTVDRLCTTTTYAQNPGIWMLDRVATEETVSVGCNATPASGDAVSGTRHYYDGHTSLTAAPSRGLVSKVEALEEYVDGVPVYTATTNNIDYDGYGRTTKVTDGLDRTTTTVYTDAIAGAVASTVKVTTPDPDGTGPKMPQTTTTSYNTAWGAPTRVEQANGHATTATYDPLGRLKTVRKPGNTSDVPDVQYDYHLADPDAGTANAVTTKTLTPNGGQHISVQLFDGLLRPRQTQTETGDYASNGTGHRMVSDILYDSRGHVAKRQDRIYQEQMPDLTITMPTTQAPLVTTYTHDAMGRETLRVEERLGEADATTTTTYDGSNNTTVVPPKGGTTTITVGDARGRTVELAEEPGGQAQQVVTSYGYTPAGQLKKISDNADPDGSADNTWIYHYDLLGRQTTAIDPDAGTTNSSYDIMGQLTATDHEGQALAYTYDRLGRRTGVFDIPQVDATPEPGAIRASWEYDSVSVGLPTGSTRYLAGQPAYTVAVTAYDDGDRPTGTATTVAAVGDIPAALAGTYSTHASYMANGSPATTEYSAQGPLAAEVLDHSYDQTGRQVNMVGTLGAYVLAAKWSVLGQVNQLALGSTYGTLSWHSFGYKEATGRLAWSQVDRQQHSEYDEKTTYGYDPVGNITRITGGTHTGPVDNQCFAYDGLRQLTEAWTPATTDWEPGVAPAVTAAQACDPAARSVEALGGVAPYWTSWTYDNATGNRATQTHHTTEGGTTTAYQYPAAGQPQPHAVTGLDTNGDQLPGEKFTYDARGNTTGRPGQTLTWDPEGHLATVTDPAGNVLQTARYDADGRRMLRQTGNTTTLYLPDGTELTHHGDTAGGEVTGRRYYTFAGRTIAVREGNNRSDVTTLFDDHQGTATYAVNNTTGADQVRRQTPFGEPRGDTPQVWPGQRGFVGGTQDPALGLVQVGARPYDPTMGIFLAADPILDPTDSRQVNGYAYANNNPTTFSDPTGKIVTAGSWSNTASEAGTAARHTARRRASGGRTNYSTHLTKIGLEPSWRPVPNCVTCFTQKDVDPLKPKPNSAQARAGQEMQQRIDARAAERQQQEVQRRERRIRQMETNVAETYKAMACLPCTLSRHGTYTATVGNGLTGANASYTRQGGENEFWLLPGYALSPSRARFRGVGAALTWGPGRPDPDVDISGNFGGCAFGLCAGLSHGYEGPVTLHGWTFAVGVGKPGLFAGVSGGSRLW